MTHSRHIPWFALPLLGILVHPVMAQHRLLLSDQLAKKVLIQEKDGRISWEYAEPGQVYDGQQLANGNVLYCWFSGGNNSLAGVKEVTPDKRIVFQYPIKQECHSVQRLPGGVTLIEDPTNRRLIEVDHNGKLSHELKLQVGHNKTHRVARQCRKLPSGNYLVAQEGDQAVLEYAPDGMIVRRIAVDGYVFGVERLANGNTLIGTGGPTETAPGRSIIEVDAKGNTVWTFQPTDFPADTNLEWVLGVHRLRNGNTVIANYLGHGKGGRGISVLEVTPDKRVVWKDAKPRVVLLVSVLP